MNNWKKLLAASCGLILAACGGGGGGGVSPAPINLTVTGTAATGLAISGATIASKCKVGQGTTTTKADGTYSQVITDGQLPCMLQITNPADGTKLHTVALGTGSTAIANVTPLTEMTISRALGGEPSVFFAAFDANIAAQKMTTANLKKAQTDIGLILASTVDTSVIGDFISSLLKAATPDSPTTGDAQDKLLDALKLKLNNVQLGMLTTALASSQTMDAIKQTVVSLSTPPKADAGNAQSVVTGSAIILDASNSTAATGSTLTYSWTLTSKPQGSKANLVSPLTVKPGFVADVTGAYEISLVVNDGKVNSASATVIVTATAANIAPVANAGVTQYVAAGNTVTLDGSLSSDANGDPMTYAWTLSSKPSGSSALLSSATSKKPTFTVDVGGTYIAILIVNDGQANSSPSTVSVEAGFPTGASGTPGVANTEPVANAGITQIVIPGSVVALDGSLSSDANSDSLTYAWTLTSKPLGSSATLSSSTSANPTFVSDIVGTYVASLVVNDGKVNSSPATVSISARTPIFTSDCASCHTTPTAQSHMSLNSGNCSLCHSPGKTIFYHWY